MAIDLQLEKMSREDKLRAMEAIWADLSQDAEAVESPDWHRKALAETEARVAAGQERIVDWDTAKRELWKKR